MWPIKEKENKTAAHTVPKSYPLYQAAGMYHYGSLININPSGSGQVSMRTFSAFSFLLLLLLGFFFMLRRKNMKICNTPNSRKESRGRHYTLDQKY